MIPYDKNGQNKQEERHNYKQQLLVHAANNTAPLPQRYVHRK
jgi:hypothetical protein